MRRWIICALTLLLSGWMFFDGTRAFLLGEYITPANGIYAGQLGPWAALLQSVGLEPHSTWIKFGFVLYGALGIAGVIAYVVRMAWSHRFLLVLSILGLWYLPFGTIIGVLVFILLQFEGKQAKSRFYSN